MLFVVEERLEGLKYNISLRGGGGTQGEGIDNYVHSAEKGCFTKVFQHLSLIAGYCSFYTKSELLQVSQWLLMNYLAATSCVFFGIAVKYIVLILSASNF